MVQVGFFASLGKTANIKLDLALRLILCQADQIDERSLGLQGISSSNKTLSGKKVDFP